MNQENLLEKAFEAIKNGEIVLVYDNDDREGEVDMIIASEFVTPETVATLRCDAGGLICNCLHPDFCDALGIPFMVDIYAEASSKYPVLDALEPNDIKYDEKSSFSFWVNHRESFTGITDIDRAMTISELAKLCAAEEFDDFGKKFRSPGHVALLRGREGLVENRQGHTEIGLALCEMAGVTPVCVVCEMMDADTHKAQSIDTVKQYALKHGLILLNGEDIIEEYLK